MSIQPAILAPGHIDGAFVAAMRRRASYGIYHGMLSSTGGLPPYLRRCTHHCPNTGATIIFTRDAGMHSSGWWKNPDYGRCWHLSLSFPGGHDRRLAERWCDAMFGADVTLLWVEPPFSDAGRRKGVWHYRLFCDAGWQPIKPRGEVYSKDWTPAEWKSWSDIHGGREHDGAFGAEIVKEAT